MEWAGTARPSRRTNSMSIENATSANWVVESAYKNGNDIVLQGSSLGYASHDQAFKDGDTVPYAMFDDDGNREAGYGTYRDQNGTRFLRNITVTATLTNGVYTENPSKGISFSTGSTVACTFNAKAFTPGAHVSDKDNPHDVNAGQIDSNLDGKTVEQVLRIILDDLNEHVGANNNPHNVTATQVPQNNSQNALGYNVQNALNKLNQNLQSHENETGNVHDVVAAQINMAPPIELAEGGTVQETLETIYERFKAGVDEDDHMHIKEVDGNETLILIRAGL